MQYHKLAYCFSPNVRISHSLSHTHSLSLSSLSLCDLIFTYLLYYNNTRHGHDDNMVLKTRICTYERW